MRKVTFWLIIGLIIVAGVLILTNPAEGKAGAVSWQFDELPVIVRSDGYWTINDPLHRCYTEPVVSVDMGWTVTCESGNIVGAPPTRPGDGASETARAEWGRKCAIENGALVCDDYEGTAEPLPPYPPIEDPVPYPGYEDKNCYEVELGVICE